MVKKKKTRKYQLRVLLSITLTNGFMMQYFGAAVSDLATEFEELYSINYSQHYGDNDMPTVNSIRCQNTHNHPPTHTNLCSHLTNYYRSCFLWKWEEWEKVSRHFSHETDVSTILTHRIPRTLNIYGNFQTPKRFHIVEQGFFRLLKCSLDIKILRWHKKKIKKNGSLIASLWKALSSTLTLSFPLWGNELSISTWNAENVFQKAAQDTPLLEVQ